MKNFLDNNFSFKNEVIPSDKKLLNSLKEIFNNEVGNGRETKPEAPDIENNPLEDKDSGKITLPDGTVIELPDTKEHEKVSRDDPDELFDDNGKQYRTEDGGWVPNNTYVLDEMTYKTDDNGNIYSVDGKLQPNTIYELNGNIYTTDEKGRIISCKAKPVRSPENPRDNEAQQQAGGEDRCPNDQGGHVVSRDMNGDGGIGNLVAMDSKINQSDYKRMENDIKTTLDEGKDVTTKTEMTYSGDSKRPDKITVTVGVDGEDTVYEFDNNLDGSMDNEISEKSPSAKVILPEHDARTVTLDDGTVVNLPESPDRTQKADSTDTQHNNSSSEVLQGEVKPTRELTEVEKTMLQETLGWTDKQISKCTIDEDGVIHYKTDREDMEGKTGENGITYERKTVDIHGIKVQGVFPVFESVCDVQLPEDLEKASNARQFKECNNQLKENIANDPELRASFTAEQLEEIEDGDTPSGYVWHHNEEAGKMQLVKVEDHNRTQGGAAHTGGKALWGGSYSNHETSTTVEPDATQHSVSNKEVE